MTNHHHHHHWIGVAVVVALGLLAFEAAAQTATAGAMFQGRPELAGAQGGLGAQAGPPLGGIGLQGSEGAGLNLRAPQVISQQMAPPPMVCTYAPGASTTEQPLCLPQVGNERFERRLALLGIDPQQRRRM